MTLIPSVLQAQDFVTRGSDAMRDTGVSGLWILANISFAGMRAQNSPSTVWRIITFLLGLPGTILTFLVVHEGSERAYGIQLPTRDEDE